MLRLLALVSLGISISPTLATTPIWGQCGGLYWSGDKTCASGSTCHFWNDWYSQCIPSTTSTTSSTTSSTSVPPVTTTSSASTTTQPTSTTTTTSTAPPPSSTGFVKTSGIEFTLDGSRFTPVGYVVRFELCAKSKTYFIISNSYWVGLSGLSDADMNLTFHDVANAGGTVVRTWGFNEITGNPWGPYYQSWFNGVPTINTGPDGLQNFDKVVSFAKSNNIRLIVTLTNNWADYGGMDVYVNQILNSTNHDLFYTDDSVKTAYKNYIKTFVGRYVNEPTIMAWELANEPRCRGTTGNWTGTCTTETITAWAKELSAYIKSIDSNHLVAIGDEGFYNWPNAPSYPYTPYECIDFDANLAIDTVDFGTFHSYPDGWVSGNYTDWGTQWIADHAASMKKANKPVILEEYGETNNQTASYTAWLAEVVSSGLTGDLIWGIVSHLSIGDIFTDPFSIYPGTPIYSLLTEHAAALKARDGSPS